jgi:MFS family permease
VKTLFLIVAVFAVALALRLGGSHQIGPYDDAYHLKRIDSFPRVIQFDHDRDAWCPWPPLYDFALGAIDIAIGTVLGTGAVVWLAPIAFALFAAALAWRFGAVAGFGVALAPYLIGISRVASIDHHWVEPMFVVLILVALMRRSVPLLAVAMTGALFVQTALIVACGLAFLSLWLFDRERRYARAFLIAAIAVAIWRFAVPFPESPWFLGGVYIVLLVAAAVALALHDRWYALPIAIALTMPFWPELYQGMHFFRGDPWLSSIEEFQPMLRDAARVGTDLANVGGGLVVVGVTGYWSLVTGRFRRSVTSSPVTLLFAIGYAVLAISSRRFLPVAIPLLCVIPSVARELGGRAARIAMTIAIVLPPLAYDVYAFTHPEPPDNPAPFVVASEIRPLPPGRVLAPWYLGHAIDVFGHHAVVIDNFGSMPDARRFEIANDALTNRHHDPLLDYCRRNGVRYLANDRAPSWHGFPQIASHVWLCSTTSLQ